MDKVDRYWEVVTPIAHLENLKVINEFLLYLKNTNRGKRSIICYRGRLQIIFREMKVSFSSLTSNNIQEWFTNHPKDWKDSTIRNYKTALSSFFNFCVEKGYIEISPLQKREANYWELRTRLPNPENQKVINEYLLYLKDLNRNESGILRIRKNLYTLFKEKKDSFSSHTIDDTKAWIEANQGRLQKHTIHDYLYYLRSFYQFCVEKGYMDENPIPFQRGEDVRYWEVKIPLPNEENKERVNEYLLSLYVANYSKFTVRSYRDILQNFFKEQIEAYSAITSAEIQEWLIQLLNRCTEGTVTLRINALNSFYQFCVEEGYMEKSPMKKRWYPRLPHPIPKYLNRKEVAKVRQHIEKGNFRDRVLVEFLLSSGCRVGEVHRLNRSDVDLERRTAMVIGKGQKIRQINFSESCAVLVERYLESRKDQHPALFVTNHWNPRRLSTKWMGTILRRMGEGAELSTNLHPHRLRHTFATNLLEKGAELSFIGGELGHKNLKTTQRYANLPKQKIKVLYRRYMG